MSPRVPVDITRAATDYPKLRLKVAHDIDKFDSLFAMLSITADTWHSDRCLQPQVSSMSMHTNGWTDVKDSAALLRIKPFFQPSPK